jgi:hypothetical protein
MAAQTILDPCGQRVNNVNNVCYRLGSVDRSDKNSAHHTFETNGHHCDLVILAHWLDTWCLTDGLDVAVKRECVSHSRRLYWWTALTHNMRV